MSQRRIVEFKVESQSLSETIEFPPIAELNRCGPIGANRKAATDYHYMLERTEDNEAEFRAWLDKVMANPERYQLYALFAWTEHAFRIDREFLGFSVYFSNFSDAVQFNFAWAQDCIAA